MSKQTASKNQASRSDVHDSMPNVYDVPSKDGQRPSPAHISVRDNIDVDESKGGESKKKNEAKRTHFHDLPGEHEETLRKGAFQNRKHPGDAKEVPNGAARARKAGPHGAQIDASGDNNAAQKKRRVARIG